jgi:hypothetical protein
LFFSPLLSEPQNGLAVWTLTIGGQAIAGRWVIIDQEFRPTE